LVHQLAQPVQRQPGQRGKIISDSPDHVAVADPDRRRAVVSVPDDHDRTSTRCEVSILSHRGRGRAPGPVIRIGGDRVMAMRAEQLTDPIVDHGEGPVYSTRWAGPRWVDMMAGDVLELGPDGTPARQHVSRVAAVIRPRRGGGHVIAGERGLLLADADELTAPVRALPEVWDEPGVRMNEGGCDPAGTLYLGSMAYDGRQGGGTLYRFDADLTVSVALPEVTISNGLDWSP